MVKKCLTGFTWLLDTGKGISILSAIFIRNQMLYTAIHLQEAQSNGILDRLTQKRGGKRIKV